MEYTDGQGRPNILVNQKFLRDVIKPDFKTRGWVMHGSHYGEMFGFSSVKDGDDPDAMTIDADKVQAMINYLKGQKESQDAKEETTAEGPKPAGDEVHKIEGGVIPPPPQPRGILHSFPLMDAPVDVTVELPESFAFEVRSGSDGKKAFLTFDTISRSVTVRFPKKHAWDVMRGAVSLIEVMVGSEGMSFLSEAMQDREKMMEVVTVLPGMLKALAALPGPAGRGAKKILAGLSMFNFEEMFKKERAEEPEQEVKEKGPRIVVCPKCGEPGRPTGREELGVPIMACDNDQCDLRIFIGEEPLERKIHVESPTGEEPGPASGSSYY